MKNLINAINMQLCINAWFYHLNMCNMMLMDYRNKEFTERIDAE